MIVYLSNLPWTNQKMKMRQEIANTLYKNVNRTQDFTVVVNITIPN